MIVTAGLLLIGVVLTAAAARGKLAGAMSKRLTTAFILVLIAAAVLSVWWAYTSETELGPDQRVTVMIAPGDGFSTVADRLVDSEVVRFETILKLAARVRGLDPSFGT